MKVKGIGEVVVTHNSVKRRLGDVRYVLKFGWNLISLCRLKDKGCFFKFSGGSLKFIRGSMMLLKREG